MVVRDDGLPNAKTYKPKLYHIYGEEGVRADLTRPAEPQETLPDLVNNAYLLLGKDWLETYELWKRSGITVPPVMITVANRTDSERFLKAIKGNYKDSTFNEKRRKLSYYSDVLFKLYTDGKITSCNPKSLTKKDIAAYVAFRRATGKRDSTIRKDLSMIGELLTFVGNDAMDLYKVVYGNKRPKSYNGRLDPLPDEVIDRVYALARSTDSWKVLEGCMAIILGCAAGLRP